MDYKEIEGWVLRAQKGDGESMAFLERMFRPLMLASADRPGRRITALRIACRMRGSFFWRV